MTHLSTSPSPANRPRLARALRTVQRAGSRLALAAAVLAGGAAQAALPASQIAALQAIYNSTNGAGWTTGTNWMNGGDPCASAAPWYGVTCDAGGATVTSFGMYNNNLTGTLPALDALADLENFNVNRNHLSGTLPALASLTKLEQFSANNNMFTGAVPAIAGHSSLLLFDVSYNQLSGTIPDLTGLPTLQHLDLSVNQLSGTIPPLAGLVTMFYLHLNDNELTGTVPALTTLALLRQFWIGNNRLTGPAPNPPFPDSLIPGQSNLCPNYLTPAATPPAVYDLAWNEATGSTPWSTYCTAPPVTVTNVPTLGEWALALLAMAMGAMAWARRPRAARSDASRG